MDRLSRLAPVGVLRITILFVLAAPPAIADPHFAPPQLPAVYDESAGRSALPRQALDHWWLLFDDPALNSLEDEALRTAPDALTQEARLIEARATFRSEIDQTLPQGEISGNASQQNAQSVTGNQNSLFPIGGVTTTESVTFSPSWEIDLFGRLAVQRRVAKYDWAATRFNIEGAVSSLVAGVADEYFNASGLGIQIEDARETVRIDSGLEQVARQKAELGLGAASDADRVAADVAQAKATLEDLTSQLHASRRRLLILIGRAAAPVDTISLRTEVADAPPPPAALPAELLTRRPDVREAEEDLRSAAGLDKLRHLALFPTFTILPQFGLSHVTQPSTGYNPATGVFYPVNQTTSIGFWTWAGGVTVPLLNIPQLLSEAKAQGARTREAAIAYEKIVQTAYGEAENAMIDLAAGERAAAVLADGEVRARRASDAASTRYKMGLDDLTTALSAEQAWRNTRDSLTLQRVQSLRRAVVAYKALGGGWAYTTQTIAPRDPPR